MSISAKLIFLCGKMAAGKSTVARDLAQRENAVLLVQDEFLDRLFPLVEDGTCREAAYLNSAVERSASSHSLAAAAHRERYAHQRGGRTEGTRPDMLVR
jgi:predicted kinase